MKNLLTLVFLLIAFNSNAQRALFGGDNNYVVPVIPFSAPAIVTNGLVVNLDAGNPDSYNGGGTNWRDLSGNGNNGTLVNGPTYGSSNGGHFLLDGTDDYISLPSSNFFNFGTGDFTLEMWVNLENVNANPHVITINGNSPYYAAIRLNYYAGNLYTYHSSTGSSWESAGANFAFSTDTWSQIIVSRISGIVKIYVNKIEKASFSLPTSLMSSGNTQIGKLSNFPSNYHTMRGKIAITRIYQSKGLTASEVTTNFDALKSRFGL